jgi:hypothetical protein
MITFWLLLRRVVFTSHHRPGGVLLLQPRDETIDLRFHPIQALFDAAQG